MPRLHLLFDRFHCREGRMPGHGAGVAQAEVDVTKPVHIIELRALGLAHERRESAGPFDHPVHGHAAEQRFAGTLEQSFGFGPLVDEALLLALHEGLEAGAVDGFHGSDNLNHRGHREHTRKIL